MTKRTRYGGEGCVVGFGLDYACAHIIILAEIPQYNGQISGSRLFSH